MINDLETSKFRASCSISPFLQRSSGFSGGLGHRSLGLSPGQCVPNRSSSQCLWDCALKQSWKGFGMLGKNGGNHPKMMGIIPKWWNTFQMPGLLQPHTGNMWDDEWWWSPIGDFLKLLSIQVHIRHPDPGSGDIGDQGCSWCAEISDTVRCRSGSSYLSLHAEQSGLEIKRKRPRCLFNRTNWQFMSILWILWHCWHSGDIWYIDLLPSALGCPDPRLNWMC